MYPGLQKACGGHGAIDIGLGTLRAKMWEAPARAARIHWAFSLLQLSHANVTSPDPASLRGSNGLPGISMSSGTLSQGHGVGRAWIACLSVPVMGNIMQYQAQKPWRGTSNPHLHPILG